MKMLLICMLVSFPAFATDRAKIRAIQVGEDGHTAANVSVFGNLHTATERSDIMVRCAANMPLVATISMVEYSVGATFTTHEDGYCQVSGDGHWMGSRARVLYSVGNQLYHRFTASIPNNLGSITVGAFDAETGFELDVSGTTCQPTAFTMRNYQGVETTAAASFNGDDISGIDFCKYNLYQITYAWLGTVSPTIGIIKDSGFVRIHTVETLEGRTYPHVPDPALPVRCKTSGTAQCRMSSFSGGAYGVGLDNIGFNAVTYRSSTKNINSNDPVVLAVFRAVPTLGGRINRRSATLSEMRAKIYPNTTGSGRARVYIVANPTLGQTPSYSAVRADSIIEVDTTVTSITGGIELISEDGAYSTTPQGGLVFTGSSLDPSKVGTVGRAGDIFAIMADRDGTTGDAYDIDLSLNWGER